jgi:hypothetical protein
MITDKFLYLDKKSQIFQANELQNFINSRSRGNDKDSN